MWVHWRIVQGLDYVLYDQISVNLLIITQTMQVLVDFILALFNISNFGILRYLATFSSPEWFQKPEKPV